MVDRRRAQYRSRGRGRAQDGESSSPSSSPPSGGEETPGEGEAPPDSSSLSARNGSTFHGGHSRLPAPSDAATGAGGGRRHALTISVPRLDAAAAPPLQPIVQPVKLSEETERQELPTDSSDSDTEMVVRRRSKAPSLTVKQDIYLLRRPEEEKGPPALETCQLQSDWDPWGAAFVRGFEWRWNWLTLQQHWLARRLQDWQQQQPPPRASRPPYELRRGEEDCRGCRRTLPLPTEEILQRREPLVVLPPQKPDEIPLELEDNSFYTSPLCHPLSHQRPLVGPAFHPLLPALPIAAPVLRPGDPLRGAASASSSLGPHCCLEDIVRPGALRRRYETVPEASSSLSSTSAPPAAPTAFSAAAGPVQMDALMVTASTSLPPTPMASRSSFRTRLPGSANVLDLPPQESVGDQAKVVAAVETPGFKVIPTEELEMLVQPASLLPQPRRFETWSLLPNPFDDFTPGPATNHTHPLIMEQKRRKAQEVVAAALSLHLTHAAIPPPIRLPLPSRPPPPPQQQQQQQQQQQRRRRQQRPQPHGAASVSSLPPVAAAPTAPSAPKRPRTRNRGASGQRARARRKFRRGATPDSASDSGDAAAMVAAWESHPELAALGELPEAGPPYPFVLRRICYHCGISSSHNWTTGPYGARTLCSLCGRRWRQGLLPTEDIHKPFSDGKQLWLTLVATAKGGPRVRAEIAPYSQEEQEAGAAAAAAAQTAPPPAATPATAARVKGRSRQGRYAAATAGALEAASPASSTRHRARDAIDPQMRLWLDLFGGTPAQHADLDASIRQLMSQAVASSSAAEPAPVADVTGTQRDPAQQEMEEAPAVLLRLRGGGDDADAADWAADDEADADDEYVALCDPAGPPPLFAAAVRSTTATTLRLALRPLPPPKTPAERAAERVAELRQEVERERSPQGGSTEDEDTGDEHYRQLHKAGEEKERAVFLGPKGKEARRREMRRLEAQRAANPYDWSQDVFYEHLSQAWQDTSAPLPPPCKQARLEEEQQHWGGPVGAGEEAGGSLGDRRERLLYLQATFPRSSLSLVRHSYAPSLPAWGGGAPPPAADAGASAPPAKRRRTLQMPPVELDILH